MNPNESIDITNITNLFSDCRLCPRNCGVNRLAGQRGYCGETASLRACRAALHFWEEPVLSGSRGSGAVFFTGCSLRCIFCQNRSIALGNDGYEVTTTQLADIFLSLQDQGAHNINLVTGAHFIPILREALIEAKNRGLSIPIVYNSSGYESVSSLRLLDGLIDIYLPDLKYESAQLGALYSNAPDYFERATQAIAEMVRQVGPPLLAASAEPLLLKRGVIVRHLILPGQIKNTKKILRYLHETYGESIYISIMNQYTPLEASLPLLQSVDSNLTRKVTPEEYDRVLRFAQRLGISRGFIQEGETASESFIPAFNGEGIINACSPTDLPPSHN